MTYQTEQAERRAALQAAVELVAQAGRTCACGAAGAIMLHKADRIDLWNYSVNMQTLPACGPCAVALMEQGWSPERSELEGDAR